MNKDFDKELIPNLFRTEYSKMVSVLCRSFGLKNIQLAQDIVSDTFLKASETWGLKGIPDKPRAWLYTVAKNRAKDYFKREDILRNKVTPYLVYQHSVVQELDSVFQEDNLHDSLLLMMFTVCDPIISIESQLCLGLRVLCGFGIDEIANALFTSKSVINKRLVRAKEKFKKHKIRIEFPSQKNINDRPLSVVHMLYLLFNEGYYSTRVATKIREDLCYDAMRLTYLLAQDKRTNTSIVNALVALFCFHASRFKARMDDYGNQILFKNQNLEKWDFDLIKKGEYYLYLSGKEQKYSRYHYEALIAYWHTRINLDEDVKWNKILLLYDHLSTIDNSKTIRLNRIYALYQVKGAQLALKEALKLDMQGYSLFHSLLAELYAKLDTNMQLIELQKAITSTKNQTDITHLKRKIDDASR